MWENHESAKTGIHFLAGVIPTLRLSSIRPFVGIPDIKYYRVLGSRLGPLMCGRP